MANSYVSLLVYVPESSRYVGTKQKFPVLLYVDPPGVKFDVCIHTVSNNNPTTIEVQTPPKKIDGPFNYILWLDNLAAGIDHTLCIEASDPDQKKARAFHRCKIRRENPQTQTSKKPKGAANISVGGGLSSPPLVCYPTNTCPGNFMSYGYVNPTNDPVSVWLVDGNGNVYPGTPVVPPPAPYDWASTFMNIPGGGVQYKLYAEDTNTGLISNVDITVQ